MDFWATIVGHRGVGPLLGLDTGSRGDLHSEDFLKRVIV